VYTRDDRFRVGLQTFLANGFLPDEAKITHIHVAASCTFFGADQSPTSTMSCDFISKAKRKRA